VDLPAGTLPPGFSMTNYFTYYSGSAVDAHGIGVDAGYLLFVTRASSAGRSQLRLL
jgi:hypothetical protein